jgi:hypothetical protein
VVGLKPSEIQGAYTALRKQFHDIVDSARLKVYDAPARVGFKVAPGKSPRVEARLYLPNWPWRPGSKKRNLDILVRVDEEFSATSERISAASVRVAYFLPRKNEAVPVLQIHYDFQNPIQQAHPIFHAQLGQINWQDGELVELGFERNIKKRKPSDFHNHRIPTAFMGYGPILLGLAADHLDHSYYSAFLTELRRNKSSAWGAMCDQLQKSLGKHGGYLHSHHWY